MRRALILVCGTLLVAGCGGASGDGGSPAELRVFDSTIHESTPTTFRASIIFGAPKITMTQEVGETFAQVECEGCWSEARGDGGPSVPMLTRVLAVPTGATVVVSDVVPVVSEVRTLLLRPYQAQDGDYSPEYEQAGPISDEAPYWEPPFVYDQGAYANDLPQPSEPVRASPVLSARNVSVVVLRVAAGQYEAASRRLTLYSKVDFTVTFVGGSTKFLDNDAGSPFDSGGPSPAHLAWNADVVERAPPFVPPDGSEYGEEFIILTHPDYRAAADRLAQHKNNLGLLTSVFTVNDGPNELGPDTKEEIKAFLDDRHARTVVRASYLLLLGDADEIEPWRLPTRYHKSGEDYPTDFPYAQINKDPYGDELFADVSLGRIPLSSPANADAVVSKIIEYELDPPAGSAASPFYGRAAMMTNFWPTRKEGENPNVEWGRNLVPRAETTIDALRDLGFDVERIYSAELDQGVSGNIPRFRSDKSELPYPLRVSDGFVWDGDKDAILAAWNAGKSVMLYTGHGSINGWGDPHFITGNVGGLSNAGLLPFVVNSCCAAGKFDDPGKQGFAESVTRTFTGGAIASVAFVRNANSRFTTAMLRGFTGSLESAAEWPRFGNIVDYARVLMAFKATANVNSKSYGIAHTHVRMLELFGDPTIRLWQTPPVRLPTEGIGYVGDAAIEVTYSPTGATITAVEDRDGVPVPVGRSKVGDDGRALIYPVVTPSGDYALRFFATRDGAIATEIGAPAGD